MKENDKPKSILNKRVAEQKQEKEPGVQPEKLQPSTVKIYTEPVNGAANPYSILVQSYTENLPASADIQFSVDASKMASSKVKLPTPNESALTEVSKPKEEPVVRKEEVKKPKEYEYKNLPPVEPAKPQKQEVSEMERLKALSKYAEPPKEEEKRQEKLEIPKGAEELFKKEEAPKEDKIESLNKLEKEAEKVNKQIEDTKKAVSGGLEDLLADLDNDEDSGKRDLGRG